MKCNGVKESIVNGSKFEITSNDVFKPVETVYEGHMGHFQTL